MPRRDDNAYLSDMLTNAHHVRAFIEGRSQQEFLSDAFFQYAVLHAVQLIGEASRMVSKARKQSLPEVPWSKIEGQRHRVVHDYLALDPLVIWRVATVHVPVLTEQLEKIVPPPPHC